MRKDRQIRLEPDVSCSQWLDICHRQSYTRLLWAGVSGVLVLGTPPPGTITRPMLLTCTYTTGKVYTHQKVLGKEASAFVFKALLVVLVLSEDDVLGVAGSVLQRYSSYC
jgi:hypothetical protein